MEAWEQVRRILKVRFGQNPGYKDKQYTGLESPSMHTHICGMTWIDHGILEEQWVHQFIHTLDTMTTNWYI